MKKAGPGTPRLRNGFRIGEPASQPDRCGPRNWEAEKKDPRIRTRRWLLTANKGGHGGPPLQFTGHLWDQTGRSYFDVGRSSSPL